MPRTLLAVTVLSLALPGCGGCSSQTQTEEIVPTGKPAEVAPPKFAESDWPWWRGIDRNGITKDDAEYPTTWSNTENVVWKARVPGHGLSSPIVVGDRVILTTADSGSQVQSVLCYDRSTGDLKWRQDVHQGNLGDKGHSHNTYASATAACDGERVFAVFRNNGMIVVTALSVDGKQLWQKEVERNDARHGFGSSPVIYKELVIVSADSKRYGFIAGLHRESGKIHWRRNRPSVGSYATPVVATLDGNDQVLLSGGEKVISYEPMTGETNWSIDAGATTTCGTITWSGDTIFFSGGYPERITAAAQVESSSAKVEWTDRLRVYVPSLLAHNGVVYGTDGSALYCLDAATGKTNWRTRISGDTYGSPTLAGGHLYFPTRNGKVTVLKPNASRAEKVAVNSLGTAMDTTPTACGGQLFLRVVDGGEDWLYCIGKKE